MGDVGRRDGQRTVTISSIGDLRALTSRRGFVKLIGLGGALVLLPRLLTACQDPDSITAPDMSNPVTIDFARGDVAILQFAYALEQLEADFYSRVVDNFSGSDLTAAEQVVLTEVRNHEVIHRDLLAAALGSDASFTLTPTYRKVNFKSRASVLATAKTLEDLGVAAYNGVAQFFSATPAGLGFLALAAKIVSVEGRHAAAVRDLSSAKTAEFAPKAFDDASTPTTVATIAQSYIVEVLRLANAPTTPAPAAAASADVIDALQLALLMEYLEVRFYTRAVAATELIAATDLTVFNTILAHDNKHLATLKALITDRGATPIAEPAFDFTLKGNVAGFDFLKDQYALFTTVAQAIEDTGVRAYKGLVPRLAADDALLTQALTIHSVEARHASEVRRLRGKKGWITNDSRDGLPLFFQPIYDGEANVIQGGVDLAPIAADFGGTAAASEAFDEPLTAQQVMAILTPFLA